MPLRSFSLRLLLTVAALLAAGCRSARPSCNPAMSSALEQLATKHAGEFTLLPIEFDDYGVECQKTQLAAVLNAIRANNASAKEKGAITIVFVHGWHHGAATENRDTFVKDLLVPLARQERDRTKDPRPIVGVYVSWRGRRWTTWTDYLPASYYDRNDAAVRIGGAGGLESLTAIMAEANRNPYSRSVFIGHSMGGLIVERAFTTAMRSYIAREAEYGKTFSWDPPADLVITINPATQALEAWRFKRTLDEWKVHLQSRTTDYANGNRPWRPLIAAIVSEGDWATSSIMFLAASLRARGADVGGEAALRPVEPVQEKRLLRYAPGFHCELLTHIVEWDDGLPPSAKPVQPCAAKDYTENVTPKALKRTVRFGAFDCPVARSYRPGDPQACMETGTDRFRLLEIDPSTSRDAGDRNLYWIMRVDNEVIQGHSKIFTTQSNGLIRGLLSLTEALAVSEKEAKTARSAFPAGVAGDALHAAAETLRTGMFGVQSTVMASTEPPGVCDVPEAITFSYTGDACAGSSANMEPCTGELTFRVQPSEVAERSCATVEWRIGDVAHSGPVVRTTVTKPTHVFVSVKGDRREPSAEGWIDAGGRPALNPPPAPDLRYRGETSGCEPKGKPCRVGEQVIFEAAIAPPDEPFVMGWDFGGGRVHGTKIAHQFSTAGKQRVVAIATSRSGDALAETDIEVVSCQAAPAPIRIRYRGDRSGCTESGGRCAAGELVRYRLDPAPTCGAVKWGNESSMLSEMTRTLASPFDAVAASVETAGGASTASVIVYADCPSCNGEPPLVDDHFKEKKVGAETPPPPAGAPPVRCAACCTFEQDKTESHTVQSGEWLSTIALRHYQTLDWSRIYDANRKVLRNRHPDRIFPGQRLKIPLCDSR